jgi:hypothetical protein
VRPPSLPVIKGGAFTTGGRVPPIKPKLGFAFRRRLNPSQVRQSAIRLENKLLLGKTAPLIYGQPGQAVATVVHSLAIGGLAINELVEQFQSDPLLFHRAWTDANPALRFSFDYA